MTMVQSSSATPFVDAVRHLPAIPSRALESAGLPGESGHWLVGHTFEFLWRTQALMRELCERHGPNFRMRPLGNPLFVVGSPDAARDVLLDRDKNFSNQLGWGTSIGKLFARGLLLRDFEEHRVDRRIMQVAFRTEAMRGYVDSMHAPIQAAVGRWPRELRLYPQLKQLTLDMASRIFLGLPLDRDTRRINSAFIAAVAASIAVVRREIPGLAFARGMRGRRTLERFFDDLVRARRQQSGADLLSELCHAKSEQGERFSDRAISDHMIFLMMAAHDTTTSSLSTIIHCLLENPVWQERVREEIVARGGAPLGWDQRDELPTLGRCFDEALRLYPPVPFVARRSVRACTLAGLQIPANSALAVSPLVSHRLREFWSEPDRFDPDRFLPERAEHSKHSHLYYPFGGGAHICLGQHFARIQVKAVLSELLGRYRIHAPRTRRARKIAAVPIPRPLDGLPVILEPLRLVM
jgi:cytochrome P450